MKEQFCSYNIALKLKELGFDEPCIAYYFNRYGDVELFSEFVIDHSKMVFYTHSEYETIAPLWQQAIDWLREKYKLHIEIYFGKDKSSIWFDPIVYTLKKPRDGYSEDDWLYEPLNEVEQEKNFYKARETAILKAIELCQKKNL